jgi:Domain of unknown function (DUF222)
MRRFAHALDPDGADAAAVTRLNRRGLTLVPMPDGSVHIRGLADEVTGALLLTAIDAASTLISGETRTAAQRRLDAAGDLARHFLASPDAPMAGGGHAHLIVTLDEESLVPPCDDLDVTDNPNGPGDEADVTATPAHDDVDDANGANDANDANGEAAREDAAADDPADESAPCTGNLTHRMRTTDAGHAGPGGTLSWVGPITASTARRIGCDADVTYVRVDGQGGAEVVGRERRFFTWSQRKAMIARDGDCCCVPFCDRPVSWGDGHHLKAWALGGTTTTNNGAIPCAAHHAMLHEGGWQLRRLPDGRYLIRHRDGKVIGPEAYPPGHNRPPPRR